MSRPLLVLALLLGCSEKSPSKVDDSAAPPALPDLPTSTCGGTPYAWLPTAETGAVVAHERDETFSLPAATIDALLEAQGYGDFTPVPHGVSLHKVRYTTQDRGELIEVTGYAAFPEVAEDTDLPMILWLHPTMGFSDACAPTAMGLVGAAFPVLMASQGYVVAAPDYIGMNGWGAGSDRPHPWAVAEPTAVASLDMARATLALAADLETLAHPDPTRLVAWGASQGGHAALFVDRYAAGYAPEVAPVAVIAAIPPTDLRALATRGVKEWSATTAGLAGALAAEARWYRWDADLDAVLQPELAADLVARMDSLCADFGDGLEISSVEEVYQPAFVAGAGAEDWGALEPWSCGLAESSLVESPVAYRSRAPVLLITGEADDLAWAPAARDDIEPLCDLGYQIQHVECAGADHVSAAADTLPLQLSWLADTLAGVPPATTCVPTAPVACALP